MSPEEEALLRELLVLAKIEPPLETWGKFTDLKEIGAGGFGTVYSAMDPVLQTRVALKLYHPHRSQRPTEELLSEARKLARVRHPNVVVVHGADEIDGQVGVWMELVEGKTLEDEIRYAKTLDAEAAAVVGIALCQALDAVHAAGVIHGDIKAQNVARGTDGRIVLMDFGAARLRDPTAVEAPETRSGTPSYMAPELFKLRGDRLVEPTAQSDVYAVGVLLFYLVTGKFPVESTSAAGVRRAHEDLTGMRLLRAERSDLRKAFVAVVERALSRSAGERYQTAVLMEQALASARIRPLELWLQRLLHHSFTVGASAVVAICAVLALSFVTSGAYRVFLGVPEQFETGGLDFGWGFQALVPVLFTWGFLLLVIATEVGLSKLAHWAVLLPRQQPSSDAVEVTKRADLVAVMGFLLGSLAWSAAIWSESTLVLALMVFVLSWLLGFPMLVTRALTSPAFPPAKASGETHLCGRVIEMVRSPVVSPVLRAAVVLSAGAVCWLGITWFQADVFRALVALTDGPVQAVTEDPLFASLSDVNQRSFSQAYSYLGFALGFSIWQVSRLELADAAVDLIRFMRWSLVVLLALTLAVTVLPYRIVWVDYERVEYDGSPAHIVATSSEQFHLFLESVTTARSRSVSREDPALMLSGTFEKLFPEQDRER